MSTMTDSRVHSNYVVQTGEAPVHHTHEEYMDVSARRLTPPCLGHTTIKSAEALGGTVLGN